jgi:hypothetical protein
MTISVRRLGCPESHLFTMIWSCFPKPVELWEVRSAAYFSHAKTRALSKEERAVRELMLKPARCRIVLHLLGIEDSDVDDIEAEIDTGEAVHDPCVPTRYGSFTTPWCSHLANRGTRVGTGTPLGPAHNVRQRSRRRRTNHCV